MLNITFYVFIGVIVLQIIYNLVVFGRFAFSKPQYIVAKRVPISVIICAKNAAENLKKLVPALANQNYPDFELVLIDNASSDDTLDVLEEFEKQYPNIRLVKVENNEAFWGNKKYALTLGIKAARKEYLLFIDADCQPASENWIANMASQFTMSKTIVLGYNGYYKKKNSLLNKIIRFDGLVNAMQYFTWAKLGSPFTGNGKNLAYKKEEFFKINGYINHMNIRIGEDALFINEAATKKNIAVCYTPESFTYRESKKSFSKWVTEKRKRAFISGFFKPFDKFQLKAYYVLQISFLLLAIVLAALQFDWMFLVPAIITRYAFTWFVVAKGAAKLNEKDAVYWYPFIEIILIFTQLYAYSANLFSKPSRWK